MKPLGNIPTLHLRFWYGPHGSLMGYNFQIFDPETNDAIHAPKGLVVQFHHTGRWHELTCLPEILRRCWDLPATPRFIPLEPSYASLILLLGRLLYQLHLWVKTPISSVTLVTTRLL